MTHATHTPGPRETTKPIQPRHMRAYRNGYASGRVRALQENCEGVPYPGFCNWVQPAFVRVWNDAFGEGYDAYKA